MGGGGDQTKTVTVRVSHGEKVADEAAPGSAFAVDVSPNDSVRAFKERVAAAISADPNSLSLSFGPTERTIGARFKGDPLVDEEAILVSQYSFLQWLEQFPHWFLTAKLAQDTPPPPGVAIKLAAASAEKEDPEAALEEAYANGELTRPEDLPAPWGSEGLDVYKRDPLVRAIGDNPVPPSYGEKSAPANNKENLRVGAGWDPAEVEIIPNVLDLE